MKSCIVTTNFQPRSFTPPSEQESKDLGYDAATDDSRNRDAIDNRYAERFIFKREKRQGTFVLPAY